MTAANAIEGPNGIGVFRPCPVRFNKIIPAIDPISAAKNSVNKRIHRTKHKTDNEKQLNIPPTHAPFRHDRDEKQDAEAH